MFCVLNSSQFHRFYKSLFTRLSFSLYLETLSQRGRLSLSLRRPPPPLTPPHNSNAYAAMKPTAPPPPHNSTVYAARKPTAPPPPLRPNKTVYAAMKPATCTSAIAGSKYRATASLTAAVQSTTNAVVATAPGTKASSSSSAPKRNIYNTAKQQATPWFVKRQQAIDRAIDKTMDYLAMQEIAHTLFFSDDDDADFH